jgi:glucose-1-phosphate thymidylyltransferase
MIHYPLKALSDAGIRDILIVTGGNHAGEFLRLLGNGKEYGLNEIAYAYQEGEGGIADALALARPFAKGDRIVVMLGDNVIEGDIRRQVAAFAGQPKGARILLKKVPDPQRFGVPVFDGGRITAIEEKPKQPKSDYAVIGIYMYDATVFDVITTLRPSDRNELEITDVNNHYIRRGEMQHDVIEGWWTDAGTFESLFRANQLVREMMIDRLTAGMR